MASNDKLTNLLNPFAPKQLPDEEGVVTVEENLGPCAWCFVKPQFALNIEDGPKPVISFQFVYLGIRSELHPDHFIITFRDGDERWRVTVKGRNLKPIFNRLCEHRIRRINTLDRDFDQHEGKPVITAIVVEPVEEGD